MNWRDKIIKYFVDDDGNYKLGIANGMTPEDLLQLMGLPSDKLTAENREIYHRARIELGAFMIKLSNEGYPAGSCSRNPSTYFIAKNNTEKELLLNKTAKNNNGRLELMKLRGEGLISNRILNNAQKEIEMYIPKTTSFDK